MMGLDKLYAQAVAAQKSGNLVEAELRYREILGAALILSGNLLNLKGAGARKP